MDNLPQPPPIDGEAPNTVTDLDAEREVLAGILVDPLQLDFVRGVLGVDSFAMPVHGAIFKAMATIADDGGDLRDRKVMGRVFSAQGRANPAQWSQAIAAVTASMTHTGSLHHYVSAVESTYQRRCIIDEADWIKVEAINGVDNQREWSGALASRFDAITDSSGGGVVLQDISDGVTEAMAHIGMIANDPNYSPGVKHAFKELARYVPYFGMGHLTVVSGQPGSGKTSWATNVAVHEAKTGGRCSVYSLEMAGLDLVTRMIAGESKVGLTQIRTGDIEGHWNALIAAADRVSAMDLQYTPVGGCSWAEIAASIRGEFRDAERAAEVARKRGAQPTVKKPTLIMIDYLQFMRMASKRSREEEINVTVVAIKALAVELNVPIILLSSMNRDNKGAEPKMSDLRGSGSIEYTADVIIMLWKPEKDDEGRRDMVIPKVRHGAAGTCRFAFNGPTCTFSDYEPTGLYG